MKTIRPKKTCDKTIQGIPANSIRKKLKNTFQDIKLLDVLHSNDDNVVAKKHSYSLKIILFDVLLYFSQIKRLQSFSYSS